jgi:molybdopterin/thiamine biosynthesis adenylyltransferase
LAQIRPETEVDRTQAALVGDGLTLPLARGTVEIEIEPGVEATTGGQRLAAVLVGVLARMKGVVRDIHILADGDPKVLPGTPLFSDRFTDGLAALVGSLNSTESTFRASLSRGPARDAAVRVHIGGTPGTADVVVASDAWRVLVGSFATEADWHATSPIGPALGAVIAAVEVFKRLVISNARETDTRLAPEDFAYSAFNYGVDADAAVGPDVSTVRLTDVAIVGCGAGGSGAAYVLAMHPRLSGAIALIEPGIHKLSNLNRYLATTADDVHRARHKLSSLVNHLVCFAPSLVLELHARRWEQLDAHPWGRLVSAVDTIEARWQIQRRARDDAEIIDLAVDDLLYSVLRVTPGGRCLFCKHPYDPDLAVKQRALRWGVPLETIRDWTVTDKPVDHGMLETLCRTQGQDRSAFIELLGVPFSETPRLLECGTTSLRADVPSQAPVLPLATSAAAAVVGAAEVIKHVTGMPRLDNWLAHDLRRRAAGPWSKHRGPVGGCPNHEH